MNEDFINHKSQSKYVENDMFINNRLELVRIQTITQLSTFPDQAMVCTSKKQQYSVSQSSNNLVLKTNEGIDVSSFIDLSKLTVYSSNKLYLITSMFRIAEIKDACHSSTGHLNNVNILYTNSASLNPAVKYDNALFDNNHEKIFDKTYCTDAYLKFKKLHDIIDETIIGYSTTSAQAIRGTTYGIISIPRF